MSIFGVEGKLWEYGFVSRTDIMTEKNEDGNFMEIAGKKAVEKDAALKKRNEVRTTGVGTYMGESYEERISKITDKAAASAFQSAYAKKMTDSMDYISNISRAYSTGKVGATNFEDAFLRYEVITHVGNANIASGNWQRNDFPFWKYFDKNTSADALNNWKPEGANPPQTRGDLQRNYSSVGSGRIAILIPESLQQKMDADPDYARQIITKLQEWKEDYDRWDNTVAASYGYNVAEYQAGKSYVFDLDENGDVRNCTVTSPGRITGPTKEELEQIEAEQAKKRERRVKYIQILQESAEKRKLQEQETKSDQTETAFLRDKEVEKPESVVDQYKRKYPKDASHVDAQVQAGKAVIKKNGVDNVSREDMTMEEYKSFINGLLKSIPFDATRRYDKEIISITDAGWEQMKNDEDYEAWVLGYTVENRSVRNPFFGWPGASGSVYVEKFGASIEEHIGQSVGTSGPGSTSGRVKDEKSWWEKRQERMDELMEEQAERAMKKAQARMAYEQEVFLNGHLAGQQKFLSLTMEGSDILRDMEMFKRISSN